MEANIGTISYLLNISTKDCIGLLKRIYPKKREFKKNELFDTGEMGIICRSSIPEFDGKDRIELNYNNLRKDFFRSTIYYEIIDKKANWRLSRPSGRDAQLRYILTESDYKKLCSILKRRKEEFLLAAGKFK